MRVLITGASGFVGRSLCRALSESGARVHALSRTPERIFLDGPIDDVTPHPGSVASPHEVARAGDGCELVVHTAGVPHPRCPERVGRWLHVAGTENVLMAARHVGARRVVHISCADVTLHDGDRLHWDELRALPGLPAGAQARSKLIAEELALAKSDETLSVTALRPAWLWGPGDYDGVAYLHRLSQGRGLPLPGGGRNLLASTHIDNLCQGVLAAFEAPRAAGRAYHVTDGDFSEAREFFGQLSRALGLPPPRNAGPLPWVLLKARMRSRMGLSGPEPAEVLRLGRGALFDLSRSTQDLGYEPRVEQAQAMRALSEWVAQAGGLEAVVAKARPMPCASDVDAQVALAGGE